MKIFISPLISVAKRHVSLPRSNSGQLHEKGRSHHGKGKRHLSQSKDLDRGERKCSRERDLAEASTDPRDQIPSIVARLTPLLADRVRDPQDLPLIHQGFVCNSAALANSIAAAVTTLWTHAGSNEKEDFPLPAVIGVSGQGKTATLSLLRDNIPLQARGLHDVIKEAIPSIRHVVAALMATFNQNTTWNAFGDEKNAVAGLLCVYKKAPASTFGVASRCNRIHPQ